MTAPNSYVPSGTTSADGEYLVDANGAPITNANPEAVINTAEGLQTTPIAAGVATNTVIKASTGRLVSVLVTATGTAAMSIYDNATTNAGTVIGIIPANQAVDGKPFVLKEPAANGITVGGSASNPGVTIDWS